MCIAILNTKKGGSLPKKYIKNSWDNNDMGAGLLWTENGVLHTFKTYEYKKFVSQYYKIRKNKSVGNIVLHFRIATSGYAGEHNLHPFLVNDDLGFVHNGVIFGLGNQKYSDTYEFNEMLKKFSHDFLSCQATNYLISKYIEGSKLVFLNSNDEYTIINEKRGHWSSGNWYSNDSYKQANDYRWYGNTKVSKSKNTSSGSSFRSYELDERWEEEWWKTPVVDEVSSDDEWEMYEYICDIYGLDPDEIGTWDDIDYYMQLCGVNTIPELYKALTDNDVIL